MVAGFAAVNVDRPGRSSGTVLHGERDLKHRFEWSGHLPQGFELSISGSTSKATLQRAVAVALL